VNFTLGNHLKYYINNQLYGNRESIIDPYRVEVGPIDPDHYSRSSWWEEQRRTADAVYRDLGQDLVVMFSGGTDSEIVIRSFLAIGIRPRAMFIRFSGGQNEGDYHTSVQVAKELDIPLSIIDFDVVDFYFSGAAAEFAAEIQCRQIAYLTVYNAIRNHGFASVMGGEMLLRRVIPRGQESEWYYTFRENEDASAMRFSIKYNIPLVNEWFSYTPEMMAYYLEHPGIQNLVETKYNYKLGSVSSKNAILKTLVPELTSRIKTHGYEKLLSFNTETYFELYKTHINRLEPSLDGILLRDLVVQLGVENNEYIKTQYRSQ